MRGHMTRNAVKEAFDNLPSGICYFNENGFPVLCNRQMRRLVFAMTGRDLQLITDLTEAISSAENIEAYRKDGSLILFPDETAWQFKSSLIISGETYTQIVASNVTEIYKRKKALEESTSEYRKMVADMKKITENVVAITREEEILTMKMHIHSEVGESLQILRRYHACDNVLKEKTDIISMLKELTDSLHGEIGKDDSADTFRELLRIAKSLGVTVELDGDIPKSAVYENLIIKAIRECITNTLKHAEGDRLFVKLTKDGSLLEAVITNNGKQPLQEITEGGGLSSLRYHIEKEGGIMSVQSRPRFALKFTLLDEREG